MSGRWRSDDVVRFDEIVPIFKQFKISDVVPITQFQFQNNLELVTFYRCLILDLKVAKIIYRWFANSWMSIFWRHWHNVCFPTHFIRWLMLSSAVVSRRSNVHWVRDIYFIVCGKIYTHYFPKEYFPKQYYINSCVGLHLLRKQYPR